MYARGDWKAETLAGRVVIRSGEEFVATFDGVYEPSEETVERRRANAERAAACVNACADLENPTHALRTLRADSGYLARYREAYCANVARQTDMELALRALSAEVLALRSVVTLGPEGEVRLFADLPLSQAVRAREDAVAKSRKAVDDLGAMDVKKFVDPARPDLSRYKGLDVRSVQLLIGAVEQLLASRREHGTASAQAVVGLIEFARLAGVLEECKEAPSMEGVR